MKKADIKLGGYYRQGSAKNGPIKVTEIGDQGLVIGEYETLDGDWLPLPRLVPNRTRPNLMSQQNIYTRDLDGPWNMNPEPTETDRHFPPDEAEWRTTKLHHSLDQTLQRYVREQVTGYLHIPEETISLSTQVTGGWDHDYKINTWSYTPVTAKLLKVTITADAVQELIPTIVMVVEETTPS